MDRDPSALSFFSISPVRIPARGNRTTNREIKRGNRGLRAFIARLPISLFLPSPATTRRVFYSTVRRLRVSKNDSMERFTDHGPGINPVPAFDSPTNDVVNVSLAATLQP